MHGLNKTKQTFVEKDTSWQDRIHDMAVGCLVKNQMPEPEVNIIYLFCHIIE